MVEPAETSKSWKEGVSKAVRESSNDNQTTNLLLQLVSKVDSLKQVSLDDRVKEISEIYGIEEDFVYDVSDNVFLLFTPPSRREMNYVHYHLNSGFLDILFQSSLFKNAFRVIDAEEETCEPYEGEPDSDSTYCLAPEDCNTLIKEFIYKGKTFYRADEEINLRTLLEEVEKHNDRALKLLPGVAEFISGIDFYTYEDDYVPLLDIFDAFTPEEVREDFNLRTSYRTKIRENIYTSGILENIDEYWFTRGEYKKVKGTRQGKKILFKSEDANDIMRMLFIRGLQYCGEEGDKDISFRGVIDQIVSFKDEVEEEEPSIPEVVKDELVEEEPLVVYEKDERTQLERSIDIWELNRRVTLGKREKVFKLSYFFDAYFSHTENRRLLSRPSKKEEAFVKYKKLIDTMKNVFEENESRIYDLSGHPFDSSPVDVFAAVHISLFEDLYIRSKDLSDIERQLDLQKTNIVNPKSAQYTRTL